MSTFRDDAEHRDEPANLTGSTLSEVITQAHGLVHTTGHPRRDELRKLYDWLKPQVLIPVHGEAAHLESHAKLGKQHGIPTVFSAVTDPLGHG